MAAIARHPGLSAIAKAAKAVGGPAIRNMATVGGNLFAPAPYGDFAVALLALDATVHTTIRRLADRGIPGWSRRQAARIVASVSFAVPAAEKLPLREGVARQAEGRVGAEHRSCHRQPTTAQVTSARIALGCMADRPIRAKAAEKALLGATLTEEGIAPAVAAVGEGTTPITDAIASAWYRSEVLPVHFRRLLLEE